MNTEEWQTGRGSDPTEPGSVSVLPIGVGAVHLGSSQYLLTFSHGAVSSTLVMSSPLPSFATDLRNCTKHTAFVWRLTVI